MVQGSSIKDATWSLIQDHTWRCIWRKSCARKNAVELKTMLLINIQEHKRQVFMSTVVIWNQIDIPQDKVSTSISKSVVFTHVTFL